jgi:hypothetical protein
MLNDEFGTGAGYYDQEDGSFDAFYGTPGGLDEPLAQDEVFSMLNEIISETAKRAKESAERGFNELAGNSLVREVCYYIIVFGIKLALFIQLRSGYARGYTNL